MIFGIFLRPKPLKPLNISLGPSSGARFVDCQYVDGPGETLITAAHLRLRCVWCRERAEIAGMCAFHAEVFDLDKFGLSTQEEIEIRARGTKDRWWIRALRWAVS